MRNWVRWAFLCGVSMGAAMAAAAGQEDRPSAGAGGATAALMPPAFPAGDGTALGRQIAAILAEPTVVRAHWGIAVVALDGKPMWGLEEGKLFRPASNAKLFTTAAAMALLGPASTVETQIEVAEPDADGVSHGDVRLRAGGDANLSQRPVPYLGPADLAARKAAGNGPAPCCTFGPLIEMAAGIAAKVKTIDGDVVASDAMWPEDRFGNSWSQDDLMWGFGAPVSAMALGDNQMQMTVTPGAKVGDAATVAILPEMAYYTVTSSVTTVGVKQPASVAMERAVGSKQVRLYGTVAMGQPDVEEISVDDPAEYAAMALKQALEADGVKVTGKARGEHKLEADSRGFTTQMLQPVTKDSLRVFPSRCGQEGAPMACRTSATLAEDVTVTLKVSQNLHAEMMLRRLGTMYGTEGSFAQGARVVRQFLLKAGLDGGDFFFYDGSGLSDHDVVTPRATARLLVYAAKQPWFAQWKAGLPVGGVDGSLAARFTDAGMKGKVFAKTGTLGESRALSGYVICASGREVAFSIMVDVHAPAGSGDRVAMDKIVAAIAANH